MCAEVIRNRGSLKREQLLSGFLAMEKIEWAEDRSYNACCASSRNALIALFDFISNHKSILKVGQACTYFILFDCNRSQDSHNESLMF